MTTESHKSHSPISPVTPLENVNRHFVGKSNPRTATSTCERPFTASGTKYGRTPSTQQKLYLA